MYLRPDGKRVVIETRDGDSIEIRNSSFYEPKLVTSRWDTRLDFGYGANIYLYLRGNPTIYDQLVLQGVLKNKQIDINNIQYDYGINESFTWEYRDLVEIKKRNRFIQRWYRPTAKNFIREINVQRWNRAKQLNATQNNK